MSRIFISYDRDDRPFTRDLAGKLRRVYDHVWFDENLYGGDEWWPEIRKQIAACDIFMFMLSEESAKSPYCRKEFDEAQSLKKEILPVRIKPIPPQNIPDFLSQIQYVDMSGGEVTTDNLIELTAAINRLSDKINQNLRDTQARLVEQRRRANLLRWVAVIVAAMAIAAVAAITFTQIPPFQGSVAYVAAKENNVEIRVMGGGVNGLWRNLRRTNPAPISIAPLNDGGIVPRPASDGGLAWSPDGKQVAFVSSRDGDADIYLMNADGSSVQPLTLNDANDRTPAWSSDGSRIAFATDRDGDWEVYVMNINGSDQRNASNQSDADDKDPAWSPLDGSEKIAFASDRDGDWDIWRMESNGGNIFNLTNNFPEEDSFPAWSPDGAWVAFQSNQGEVLDTAVDPLEDIGIESDLGQSSSLSAVCTASNWNIFAVDADNGANGGLVPIAQNSLFNEQYAAWSPDGVFLSYISNQSGDADVYIVRFNDRNAQPILLNNDTGDVDGFPVWRR
jgi:Tol biopolymer transport system component